MHPTRKILARSFDKLPNFIQICPWDQRLLDAGWDQRLTSYHLVCFIEQRQSLNVFPWTLPHHTEKHFSTAPEPIWG